eukprot:g8557.t1
MAEQTQARDTGEFTALLDEFFTEGHFKEGTVVPGTVVGIEQDVVLVDVGLKSVGCVALSEFAGRTPPIQVGEHLDVYLERFEGRDGETVLGYEKALREASWNQLEEQYKKNLPVKGIMTGRVKGGFTVDLSGALAFLPASQIDVRPIKDTSSFMGLEQPFLILKMDRQRSNIVVSRRAVMEESRAEERSKLIDSLEEGQILTGTVKNLTTYGAFVDLGGIDGLLHLTDMSWKRINHPSEVLSVHKEIRVKVIRFDHEKERISLGLKQLESDPWEGVEQRFSKGARVKGVVTNVIDYGAFVELEESIEGLIHVSEMSWSKKNIFPGNVVSVSQEVEVEILDVDPSRRRISLGLKQCMENPWEKIIREYPVGKELEGEIKSVTEFGVFVNLTADIDGMVHLSDLSWDQEGEELLSSYRKGDMLRVKVLEIDVEKERISLGVKQLTENPLKEKITSIKKGADGEVYAVGQGPVSVGGYQAAGADGTTTTKGVPTNGSIPNGAIIEKEIPYNLEKLATVRFVLSNPDFTTAKRIADEINRNFGKISRALDSGTVRISIPDSYQAYPLMFISQVEQLKIIPDQMARIVIDEKNGVIIMGENVKIRKGAISHGELVVKIDESQNVSQPNPLTGGGNASNPTVTNPGGLTAMGPGGQTVVTPESKVNVREEKASIAMFDGPRLEDVVQAFRDLKVPQAEISSILQNMKKAGMIQADIEAQHGSSKPKRINYPRPGVETLDERAKTLPHAFLSQMLGVLVEPLLEKVDPEVGSMVSDAPKASWMKHIMRQTYSDLLAHDPCFGALKATLKEAASESDSKMEICG